jgi:hypothetical protein
MMLQMVLIKTSNFKHFFSPTFIPQLSQWLIRQRSDSSRIYPSAKGDGSRLRQL